MLSDEAHIGKWVSVGDDHITRLPGEAERDDPTPPTPPSTFSSKTVYRSCSGTTSWRKPMVESHGRRGVDANRGRRLCPPHGPHLVDVVEAGSYVGRCLQCGLVP